MKKLSFIANEKGTSFITASIGVLVLGLIVAVSTQLFATHTIQNKKDITVERQNVINKALNQYIEAHGRLPCPAPLTAQFDDAGGTFGREVNGGNCNDIAITHPGVETRAGSKGGVVQIGAVPVRTIGIDDEFTIDGYGKRYLYTVTGHFTKQSSDIDFTTDDGEISIIDNNNNHVTATAGNVIYTVLAMGDGNKGAFNTAGIEIEPCQKINASDPECYQNGTLRVSSQKTLDSDASAYSYASTPSQYSWERIEGSCSCPDKTKSVTVQCVSLDADTADTHGRNDQTTDRMRAIKAALQSFAETHGRYPCPASMEVMDYEADFGQEVNGGNCASASISGIESGTGGNGEDFRMGVVPVAALGKAAHYSRDGYNKRFIYTVNKDYTSGSGAPFDLSTTEDGADMDAKDAGITIWVVSSLAAYPERVVADHNCLGEKPDDSPLSCAEDVAEVGNCFGWQAGAWSQPTCPCDSTRSRTWNCETRQRNGSSTFTSVAAHLDCDREIDLRPIGGVNFLTQLEVENCEACPEPPGDGGDGGDGGDPLVLDLNGDGIHLTTVEEGVMFDMNNDGVRDRSAWLTADDGLLFYDRNQNGVVDGQIELFGDMERGIGAYQDLSQYDSNNDGLITNGDWIWNKLQVWQDANVNGISEARELNTLDYWDITEIDLGYTVVDEQMAGNDIKARGTFTRMVDGLKAIKSTITEVWFKFFS